MAKLYTVESFAVYHGITLSTEDNKYFFSLLFIDDEAPKSGRIYLEKKLCKDLSIIKLGMRKWPTVLEASFVLGNSKSNPTLRKSIKKDTFKIFRAAYDEFKVITGRAEYLINPSSKERYILVKIYPNTKLKLLSKGTSKIISYADLK